MSETTTQTEITLEPRRICGVVRSGYHNGAYCRPGEPHDGWGCGYRYELSLAATPENAAMLETLGFRVLPLVAAVDSTGEDKQQ